MSAERKCFEMKSIAGHTFFDYWDLQSHPLFLELNKKDKPQYIYFNEIPFHGCIKVTSLTDIRDLILKRGIGK